MFYEVAKRTVVETTFFLIMMLEFWIIWSGIKCCFRMLRNKIRNLKAKKTKAL